MSDVLDRFGAATREWFQGAFTKPTTAQTGAWEAISHGKNALVVAPTGSGKTLSAFLWSIDRVFHEPRPDGPQRTSVLYISPLKALGVDVERNLRSPLIGISHAARRLGTEPPVVTVGVRSGDTPSNERTKMVRNPPDILITTPESLYLMLTSRAADTLKGVHTVIIDEVHAVAATKRGAHLAVSLERLDNLLEKPAQRIGLSATVRPIDEVARFLGGSAPVEIVAPKASKTFDLNVVVPIDDMTNPPVPENDGADWFDADGPVLTEVTGSVWPHVEEAIVDRIVANTSTIVFANSRRLAERLTGRLNEIYAERFGLAVDGTPLNLGDDSHTGGRATNGTMGRGTSTGAGAKMKIPDMVAQAGISAGVAPVLAKAHHGSVSKEQRSLVEEELKSGVLRCVVATSSLELGIDMGAVDLVIQVEAPPSAASGLQRVGRAGHQVGEISRAALFPKHRADVLHTAIVTERMLKGQIEAIAIPQNPLDILAQQTVAASALDALHVEDWFETVKRSAPFRNLPRSAFEATLDLLAGKYPSEEFAELRPRVVWDRDLGTITGRPGAQRLAVTSGGTIPDRGLFGVFVAGESRGARVGELDEEMVYESRVNDVFTLGTTSWRIVEITHDRVNVVPAFGQPGRLPFWHGDGLGRPAELGEALGAMSRALISAPREKAEARLADAGLDDKARDNLLAYLTEQREATGTLPTDKTLTVERGKDDVGDWRLILHSPYGRSVHAPWALAIGSRIRERLGVDGAAVASDDGIIVRIPDAISEPPGADLFVFDADELEQLVTEEVGGSALFAARFRECAARALLMPRVNPHKRTPLWQQRQRSAQLLEVARNHPTFPIILETLREVLQDVYDLPALLRITRQIAERQIRLIEVEPAQASPYAKDLLFGYVGEFMYEGDSPLAERRAAALSVDPTLLGELLGKVEMRQLLDPDVIAQFEAEQQRLTPDRRARGVEGVADLLRVLGPLTATELALRLQGSEENDGATGAAASGTMSTSDGTIGAAPGEAAATAPGYAHAGNAPDAASAADGPGSLHDHTHDRDHDHTHNRDRDHRHDADRTHASGHSHDHDTGHTAVTPHDPGHATLAEAQAFANALVDTRRAIVVTVAGEQRFAAIEDAGRLRDALGVALPVGVPVAFLEPLADPLADLVTRFARTHGPFAAERISTWLGLGVAIVRHTLQRLESAGRVQSGFFLPEGRGDEAEWCDTEVLRRLRLRSLAALRGAVEPVAPEAYARFLPDWQHLTRPLEGIDGVVAAIDQLAGVPIPASAWESLILPSRVHNYTPAMLDELTATGEVLWAGVGALPGRDGWVSLHLADSAPLTLTPPEGEVAEGSLGQRLVNILGAGGAYFASQLQHLADAENEQSVIDALWELVWAGRVTNDTFAPLRTLTGGGSQAHRVTRKTPRARLYRGSATRTSLPTPPRPPALGGRWSLLPEAGEESAQRVAATASLLLDRYGVVTRGPVQSAQIPGGFAQVYRTLATFETAGHCRRGYFIEKLGAAQFASSTTIDRLRQFSQLSDPPPLAAITLAATDPANAYGAALSWPALDGVKHRPGRKAGGLVTLVDGELVLYLERGGRTALAFTKDEDVLRAATTNLVQTSRARKLETLTIEQVNGEFVYTSPVGRALRDAGFVESTKGLTFRKAGPGA